MIEPVIMYGIITVMLLVIECAYFMIADMLNIVDKPNERSSHSNVVLRGGGIIFLIGIWLYSVFYGFQYPWFLAGLTVVSVISFIDDVRSLPDSLRLVVQFAAAVMAFHQIGILHWYMWWIVIIGLIAYVGITNVYNFMDGINGITGGYSLAVLIPMSLLNGHSEFVDSDMIVVTILSVVVFCIFNFRPKGKAKCFAGDVGSISIAFIILFVLGCIIIGTKDVTYLVFLVVYGTDACLTIVHRIFLRENLGQAHRKHAYQIMANELNIGHIRVSLIYMFLQAAVSLVFIYLIPDSALAHWIYLAAVVLVLSISYILFMKKFYPMHEEYLRTLDN